MNTLQALRQKTKNYKTPDGLKICIPTIEKKLSEYLNLKYPNSQQIIPAYVVEEDVDELGVAIEWENHEDIGNVINRLKLQLDTSAPKRHPIYITPFTVFDDPHFIIDNPGMYSIYGWAELSKTNAVEYYQKKWQFL